MATGELTFKSMSRNANYHRASRVRFEHDFDAQRRTKLSTMRQNTSAFRSIFRFTFASNLRMSSLPPLKAIRKIFRINQLVLRRVLRILIHCVGRIGE
ncbi:hypothetical protein CGZ80_05535 [Rhodopirellula sp. MGV]|nr:hypothetical protein CGZ80_05535 [Rhodopirellula sp. MGV]PNY36425.1 hypothetical protein C2E31_13415 [Rhodopirellula baltica]